MSYVLVFLSGLCTALPFLFPSLWALEWFSIIPLFYFAPRVKKRYLHGLAFGMGFYLPIYYWFIKLYPMDFVGFTPLEGGITVALCWILLALLQASEMALISLAYGRIAAKKTKYANFISPLIAASSFTVFEWAQSLFWHGVPWARLALSQTGFLPMVQSASLLGSMFICFLIALTNGIFSILLPILWEKRASFSGTGKKTAAFGMILAVLLIPTVNALWGTLHISSLEKTIASAPSVRVAVIQGNIASGDKWAEQSLASSTNKYLELSQQIIAQADPDIVLWPETVVTTVLSESPNYRWKLSDFARRNEITLVVGAYEYGGENDDERYNALYAFYPDGSCDENVYKKRHLVPFGEYLPLAWLFEKIPLLSDLNLSESALTPGTDSLLFDTPHGKIGGLVCFDSIYDSLARDSTIDGAELLLLSTNDSWYRDSHAIYQHNSHAVLRAIENGRSIGRAANTGISTLILPTGELVGALQPMVDGTLCGDLPLMQITTLYQTVGNLIVWISILILLARLTQILTAYFLKKSTRRGETHL